MIPVVAEPSGASLGLFGRLEAFATNIFEPKLHLTFAAAWSLSLLGSLQVVSGMKAWRLDRTAPAVVISVFLGLFFLRMIDEVKDYAYDVVHNPGRPLVSGLVTRSDIARYCALFAVVMLALNASIARPLAMWLLVVLAYGLLQIPLERRFKPVRDNLLVNLVTVYPVNVGLSIYTFLFFLTRTGSAVQSSQILLVVAYACAFLHFEFARKSGWPHLAQPGERLYSQIVGLRGSLAISSAFAFGALGLVVWLLAPWAQSGVGRITGWLPLVCLVPMGIGTWLFAKNRERRHAARPPAVAFLFAFYLTMLVHAVASQHLVWSQG